MHPPEHINPPTSLAAHGQPSFRSGAVARLAGMPVSTLRIWEQRYQAVAPTTAPTGHRQYSADGVKRVVQLRRLTQQGHAIGTLAELTNEQLNQLALTHTAAQSERAIPARREAALRIVVVGRALAQRLERPSAVSRWAAAPVVVAVFDSLAEAAQAVVPAGANPIDVLVWSAPGLQADAMSELAAARHAWNVREVAVAYRFAGAAARDALIRLGASVVREPADDAALVAWLGSFARLSNETSLAPAGSPRTAGAWSLDTMSQGAGAAPDRRFDDETLIAFAGLTSSVSCECPGHVAELLMQIASFERYSEGCANRSPADAELHVYLQRVAGVARHLFETALERVATAEGLALP